MARPARSVSAVLLKGEVTQDGLATAKALKAELEGRDDALVLFGVKAADDDQQQVGPMTATLLGRPCVTAVANFEIQDGKAVCHREVEGGQEVVEVPLPAVLTITKGTFDPRYASLKGIMAAKRKPLEQKDARSAPRAGSWARAPTPQRSWSGSFVKKPRFSRRPHVEHSRYRRAAGRRHPGGLP